MFAILSSIVKVVVAVTGTFYWDRLHWSILYILCLDYLGVASWYWWLVGQVLQGQGRLQMIALYVSVMVLLLLASAAIGTVWKLWIIALEVSRVSGCIIYVILILILLGSTCLNRHLDDFSAVPLWITRVTVLPLWAQVGLFLE